MNAARRAVTLRWLGILAAAAGAALFAGGAGAQQGTVPGEVARSAPGMVTAQTLAAPPPAFTVSVAPYDDTDLNLKLKADFETALTARWQATVRAESAAAYLLLFESEVVPANLAPPPPSLGSANVTEGGAEVSVNVWSTSKDSVLGGRQQAPEAGSNVFHINAILRDRATGEVAWQGDAYYVLREPEPERVARALVAPLVDRIGQSVVREPLALD